MARARARAYCRGRQASITIADGEGGIARALKVLNSFKTILIAILCCALFTRAAETQDRPYYFGRTTDPTPVEVALQDRGEVIRFKIPKVYMTFSDNWQGGVQDFIVLETIFPSMAPLSATRSSERGADVVAIDLHSYEHTGAGINVSRLLEWKISTQWTLVDRIADQSGQKFRVYVDKGDENKWATRDVMETEYLVPDNDASPPDIYFDCLRDETNPGAGCIAKSNFGQNLALELSFKRSQLGHWREIRDGAVNLLGGFKREAER
jgi:hypothetical protein